MQTYSTFVLVLLHLAEPALVEHFAIVMFPAFMVRIHQASVSVVEKQIALPVVAVLLAVWRIAALVTVLRMAA